MKNLRITFFAITLAALITAFGCKKLVEIDEPITGLNNATVYGNQKSAIAVLTGIYTKISKDGINGGIGNLSYAPGLSSDELTLFNGSTDITLLNYYKNNLTSSTTGAFDYWESSYPVIYTANSAIEGISSSKQLTNSVKNQLIGEAKFIRAFYYFYLVNLYGDVPLVLSTNYADNTKISRTPTSEVYSQIISDLLEAKGLLSSDFLDAQLLSNPSERVTPTKWAASAMLARTYLYRSEFRKAEAEAGVIINNSSVFDTVSINDVFLRTSKEAIWQIQPVGNFITNTLDARLFVLGGNGPDPVFNPVYLTDNLVEKFESRDKRKENWINSVTVGSKKYPYAFKYKVKSFFAPVSEYTMVLRLAEQYLIRSEARIELGDVPGAVGDINIIRKRAGLDKYSGSLDKVSLLNEISHQRRLELFTEWGHRWFDLKRTKTVNDILGQIKGSNWQANDQLYPIPQSEIDKNPLLQGHQNPGYK